MAGGSLQLYEYPTDVVRLSCAKCGRAGQYRKQNRIARYGPDVRLPDLRWEISQCSRRGLMHDACMVHYVELTMKKRAAQGEGTAPRETATIYGPGGSGERGRPQTVE